MKIRIVNDETVSAPGEWITVPTREGKRELFTIMEQRYRDCIPPGFHAVEFKNPKKAKHDPDRNR